MKKAIKKEVKTTVETAFDQVFHVLEIKKPSKKTKRAISNVSKKIKVDLQKQLKKAISKISKSKPAKLVKTETPAKEVER